MKDSTQYREDTEVSRNRSDAAAVVDRFVSALTSLLLLSSSLSAVIFSRFGGMKKEVYGEGTHFRIPGIEYQTTYDIRSKPRVIRSPTGTRDLQMVNIQLRILSKPAAESIALIHQSVQ